MKKSRQKLQGKGQSRNAHAWRLVCRSRGREAVQWWTRWKSVPVGRHGNEQGLVIEARRMQETAEHEKKARSLFARECLVVLGPWDKRDAP